MLARIRDSFSSRAANVALLGLIAGLFASCATKQEPALVSDPAGARESSLPWNQQEKWEGQGQFGPMAERMGQGARR